MREKKIVCVQFASGSSSNELSALPFTMLELSWLDFHRFFSSSRVDAVVCPKKLLLSFFFSPSFFPSSSLNNTNSSNNNTSNLKIQWKKSFSYILFLHSFPPCSTSYCWTPLFIAKVHEKHIGQNPPTQLGWRWQERDVNLHEKFLCCSLSLTWPPLKHIFIKPEANWVNNKSECEMRNSQRFEWNVNVSTEPTIMETT